MEVKLLIQKSVRLEKLYSLVSAEKSSGSFWLSLKIDLQKFIPSWIFRVKHKRRL